MKALFLTVIVLFVVLWVLAGIYLIHELWKLLFTPDDKEIECADYPEQGCPFDDETTKM